MHDLVAVIGLLLASAVLVFVIAVAVATVHRAWLWRQVKRDAEAAARRRILTVDHRRRHVA